MADNSKIAGFSKRMFGFMVKSRKAPEGKIEQFTGGKNIQRRKFIARPAAFIIAFALSFAIVTANDRGVFKSPEEHKAAPIASKVLAMPYSEVETLDHGVAYKLLDDMETADDKANPATKDNPRVGLTLTMNDMRADAYHKIYRGTTLDPDFLADNNDERRALANFILTSPIIGEASRNWETADNATRVDYLQQISNTHSGIFGFKPAKIQTKELGSMKVLGITVGVVRGYWDGKAITFNTDKASGWNDFPEILSTTIHENSHNHQSQMAAMVIDGRIAKSDPRYDQARLFRANSKRYRPGNAKATDMILGTGMAIYQRQPMERHSFFSGNLAGNLMKIRYKMEKEGISPSITDKDLRELEKRTLKHHVSRGFGL